MALGTTFESNDNLHYGLWRYHTKEVELQAGQKIPEFCPLDSQGVELGTSSCSAATFSNGDKYREELAAAISSSLCLSQRLLF